MRRLAQQGSESVRETAQPAPGATKEKNQTRKQQLARQPQRPKQQPKPAKQQSKPAKQQTRLQLLA